MVDKVKAEDAREIFLSNAPFVLGELSQVLRGEGDFSCKSQQTLSSYMSTLQRLIESASDKTTMDSLSIKNITQGLVTGKISIQMAQQCMDILKAKQDIEELPKLIETMQAILDKQTSE